MHTNRFCVSRCWRLIQLARKDFNSSSYSQWKEHLGLCGDILVQFLKQRPFHCSRASGADSFSNAVVERRESTVCHVVVGLHNGAVFPRYTTYGT
jgi:hypothetical protein